MYSIDHLRRNVSPTNKQLKSHTLTLLSLSLLIMELAVDWLVAGTITPLYYTGLQNLIFDWS